MNKRVLLIIFWMFFLTEFAGFAQIDIRSKVKQKAVERIDRRVDEGIDKALDQIEAAPESQSPQDAGENIPTHDTKQAKQEVQEQGKTPFSTYSKFDFIPGEKVIFFDDFSQEKVGDFPVHWNTNKSGEIITTNHYPGHWFMMKEEGLFFLDGGLSLPENFTLEFDVIPVRLSEESQAAGFDITLIASDEDGFYPSMFVPGKSGIAINLYDKGGIHTYANYNDASYIMNGEYAKPAGLFNTNERNHVAFWVQKTRLRLYLNAEKIFDLPRALQAGHQYNQIRFRTEEESYPLISNFRIADATPDTRSKLITEGKMVTRGITFDTGSDVIKPVSYAVLKEISLVLKENPNVSVRIVGHTDSDGNDSDNLVLSRKRAAAVKNALVKEFGVAAGRMETDGKGESDPVSPNTTAEGKANNRRVEFIKI